MRVRWTARLRLEPVEARHARDLWRMHKDARISEWHAGEWSVSKAERSAAAMGDAWKSDGVSKWIAYHRVTGELVGRGGCSRAVIDGERCVEIGWAIRDDFLGRGYATEIGCEGLAFDVLDAPEVLSFTEVHNAASRAVMERIGMSHHKDVVAHGLVEGRAGIHPDALFAVYKIPRPLSIPSGS